MLASGPAGRYTGDFLAPAPRLLPPRRGTMHTFDDSPAPTTASTAGPWWRGVTRYQWFVFVVACLGWTFDTMDQRIFIMSREAALTQLLGYQRDPQTGQPASHDGQPLTTTKAVEDAKGEI